MRTIALALTLTIALINTALASGGDPLPTPKGTPKANAESAYNEGLALANAGDFAGAEAAYRDAINFNPRLAEAWNGHGHSLKKQKRFDESLAAYDKALQLRPNFPLAMQYLGELYVDLGQMNNARALLAKLRGLDEANANKLAEAIAIGSAKW